MFSTYPDVSSCWQLLNFLLFCRPASFLKDRPHHKSRGNEWPTRAGSLRINWMADDCLYCPSTSKRKLCPFAPLNTQCAAMCRLGFSRPNIIRPKLLADEKTSCLLFVFCLAEANRCCWRKQHREEIEQALQHYEHWPHLSFKGLLQRGKYNDGTKKEEEEEGSC